MADDLAAIREARAVSDRISALVARVPDMLDSEFAPEALGLIMEANNALADLLAAFDRIGADTLTPNEAWKAWGALNMVGPDGTEFGLRCWEGAMAKLLRIAGDTGEAT